jgi:hypothetical protein
MYPMASDSLLRCCSGGGRCNPDLRQFEHRNAGFLGVQQLGGQAIAADGGAGRLEAVGGSAAFPESPAAGQAFPGEEDHGNAEPGGFGAGGGGGMSAGFLLDLHHVGAEVGEESLEGAATPAEVGWIRKVSLGGDRGDANAAVFPGYAAGHGHGEGHALADEGAKFSAVGGVEVGMGEDDGAH